MMFRLLTLPNDSPLVAYSRMTGDQNEQLIMVNSGLPSRSTGGPTSDRS
jgi:hypothetical protein